MTLGIFLLVLCAAALHATWNALVKGAADKSVSMTAVVLGQGLSGAIAISFSPFPGAEVWPYILGSVVLHVGYQEFLKTAYRIGDLSQVYPIARGVAPLIVAAVTVIFMQVELQQVELFGILLIGAGIASLSLVRREDGQRNGMAALAALITGCFIAAYSIVDGIGVRLGGSALGFFGWVAFCNGLVYLAYTALRRPLILRAIPDAWPIVLIGGGASFAAYAMVVYAFLFAPIAMVTALRETSIIFATIIGVVVLKERLNLAKVVSTMVTICGAALLRFGRG